MLARLWTGGDTNNPRCVFEYQEIKEAVGFERRENISSYKDLFTKGKYNNRKSVLLGMLSQIIQQLGGINVSWFTCVTGIIT